MVLDSVDTTNRSPVNATIGDLALIEDSWLFGWFLWDSSHVLLVLGLGHGREHVVAKSEGALLVVPVINVGVLGLEQLVSELVLLSGSERKSLCLNMGSELISKLDSGLVLLEEVLESENGSSLNEVHHL